MLKIENTEVMGWEHAIRGMRNPKNSWEKTDSYPAVDCGKCGKIEREGICKKEDRDCTGFECFEVGPNDRVGYDDLFTHSVCFLRSLNIWVEVHASRAILRDINCYHLFSFLRQLWVYSCRHTWFR